MRQNGMRLPISSLRWIDRFDARYSGETMQMDILRCKTPELVRKEIWTHTSKSLTPSLLTGLLIGPTALNLAEKNEDPDLTTD